MAVVKLGSKVKTNLPATLKYVINPAKNDDGRLVYASYSGEKHDAIALAEPMIHDLERCANGLCRDGVLALHLKHSFSPDEHVTAEQVHELGVMLAEAITGGDYKYVVSTHMDRHHLHNHIVICAANRRTGRKMRLTRKSIDRWRAISDEICRREGLGVLENPSVEAAMKHDELREVMLRAPGQDDEPAPFRPATTIAATGVGVGMNELYAAAKGKGVKERMRILIDLDAARANSIGELFRLLDSHGISLSVRGGEATFMDKATGRRFRGPRLGAAYTLDRIGTRISNGAGMLHLTFNQRLVASETERTVSVWLPGSKRRRKVSLPIGMLRRDGSTWHVLMPATFTGMLTDRANRYAARFDADTLADAFGRPGQRVEPMAQRPRTQDARYASSEPQRRYYEAQARRLDELTALAEGLNAACRIQREAGGDLAKGMRDLNNRAEWARGELRAAVIAMNDAISNNDPDLAVATRGEMERREQAVLECQHDLDAIDLIARSSGVRLPERTSKEHDNEPEQQYGNRSDGRHVLPNVRPDDTTETTGITGGRADGIPRRGRVGGGEPAARTADRGTGGREFNALIRESRASIDESKALVNESDAQETTLRTQRDHETARGNQEKGTRLRRKGRTL